MKPPNTPFLGVTHGLVVTDATDRVPADSGHFGDSCRAVPAMTAAVETVDGHRRHPLLRDYPRLPHFRSGPGILSIPNLE